MKKVTKLLGIIAFIAVIGFLMASCATVVPNLDYTLPTSGTTNNAVLAIKDFQSVGIIFVESTEVIDGNGNHTGSKITYQMLMQEAQRLNADDIINIRIDVNEVRDFVPSTDGLNTVQRVTYNYKATALAIRYTAAIQGVSSATSPRAQGPQSITTPEATAPVAQEAVAPAKSYSRSVFYLGGVIGGGFFESEQVNSYFNGYETSYSYNVYLGSVLAAGLVADFTPLVLSFSNSVSLEAGLDVAIAVGLVNFGEEIVPVIPITAKIGPRFGKTGLSFGLGYTVGVGFTYGIGLDFLTKNGKFFIQYYGMEDMEDASSSNSNTSIYVWTLGYKWGL